MLQISQIALDQLRRHGEASYPEESCGVLAGIASGEERLAISAIAIENSAESRCNRYRIAPVELIRAEKAARAAGHVLIGFYHSHPDHPAQPSATDFEEAHWLGCSYVITTVVGGAAAETRSFYLEGTREEDKRLETETLRIVIL